MKIVFLQPNNDTSVLTSTLANYSEPGMSCVASIAKRLGHAVAQFQQIWQTKDEVVSEINQVSPELICLSCFTHTVFSSIEIARKFRHIWGNKVVIIVGGSGATAEYPILLNSGYFDCAVLGEGEQTFIELVDAFENQLGLYEVPGIAFKDGNKIVLTKKRKRISDLDKLPHLLREGLPVGSRYYQRYAPLEIAPSDQKKCSIYTSRGCPYKCSFCMNETEWGSLWICRDPDDVADEILETHERYNINFVGIEDEDSLIKLDNIFQIMAQVNSSANRLIRYYLEGRIDDLTGEEDFNKLYDSGCIEIEFGIESNSPEVRAKYNKKINEDKILWAFDEAKKSGIATHAMFIIGDVHENPKTLNDLYEFCRKIQADRYRFSFVTPFNGTKFRKDLPEKYIRQKDLTKWTTDYPVMVSEYFSLEALDAARKDLIKSIYDSQWYLKSAARRISSTPALAKSYEEFIGFIKKANCLN